MITIIDCGISNLHSISKALEFVGAEVLVTNKAKDIQKAERIVLPGVGAFGKAMDNLERLGLADVLTEQVINNKKPFLGICLGMQVLAEEGTEFGRRKGLGWLKSKVLPLENQKNSLRVPHMGWDNVIIKEKNHLFSGLEKSPTFYFVHSYYMAFDSAENIVATCDYGVEFPAAVLKENIFAVQFHPEKSQKLGLKLLENFINWKV